MTDTTDTSFAAQAQRAYESRTQLISVLEHTDEYPYQLEHSALQRTVVDLCRLQSMTHALNKNAGWWDKPREDGTLLMLMVSEISEAMEGNRKDLMDDHLPHRKMEEVELADALIRILDYADFKGYDVASAVIEKLAYNTQRADHKREVREKAGGKNY